MFNKFRPQASDLVEARIERRWLRSVIAASNEPLPAFPWMRSAKTTAAPRETIEVIIGDGHRRTAALFRRNGPAGGLAAR